MTEFFNFSNAFPPASGRWAWEEKGRTRGREARKWHVDNEYHVQNLLYLVLAPIFPDLKDEEYFPSIGQKQPRTDLYIPSMKLIVEAKFLRRNDKVTKVIDEVGSDASLHLKDGSGYAGIIAFVWDDARGNEEHALLRDGLREIRGVLEAVVVSRPGRMGADSGPGTVEVFEVLGAFAEHPETSVAGLGVEAGLGQGRCRRTAGHRDCETDRKHHLADNSHGDLHRCRSVRHVIYRATRSGRPRCVTSCSFASTRDTTGSGSGA